MSESFIYFLWQFQYFDHKQLCTTDGEPIQVLYPGFRNNHAGPDFTDARLLINEVEWVGTVEIHVKASDWFLHRHQQDAAYDTVILHLVWDADKTVQRTDGTVIPTLSLRDRTDPQLIFRYEALHTSGDLIPCSAHWPRLNTLTIISMLDQALLRRLERKAADVLAIVVHTKLDWEETTYQLLAVNLGFKINAGPMHQLSRAVPLKILQKHRNAPLQVEAMLFGVAGLLDDIAESDEYLDSLRREYRFLAVKYQLADKKLPTHIWKWARLRPAGFPTLRIAQLAQLVVQTPSLFSLLTSTDDISLLLSALQVKPSVYWQTHYRFGKKTEKGAPTLGGASAVNILINSASPLLAAYAQHKQASAYIDRAIALLEELPAEQNTILEIWQQIGYDARNALDSQALIELYNQYCIPKNCLRCRIGARLVGQKS
ncbi:DUF2851 family protein [Arsenicibacter rosenii]|uniref:DUF2851 domain-containing protein n=1 Tax=Arsenicibacter rosenii TaxID=1750698 RepID=A0A1S2VJR1_9BACT|nr:DUF2851 family protein [Arsenicibacter rosenii]OIN59017.1 hypothetical protein BLX24_12450 [Arsenicibacter rosenii]